MNTAMLAAVASQPTTTFSDNFNRADSATTPGGLWTVVAGVAGISSNQMYFPSGGSLHGGTEGVALVNVGKSDLDCSWDVTQGSGTQQIDFFIASDASNANAVDCLIDSATGLAYIYELIAGSFVGFTSAAFTVNPTTQYHLRAVKVGTGVDLYINGTKIVSRTLSRSFTGTWVGPRSNFFSGNIAQNNRWDNVVVL